MSCTSPARGRRCPRVERQVADIARVADSSGLLAAVMLKPKALRGGSSCPLGLDCQSRSLGESRRVELASRVESREMQIDNLRDGGTTIAAIHHVASIPITIESQSSRGHRGFFFFSIFY